MKNIQFLQNFGGFKTGEHAMAPDQVACDAIACGAAVPSVEALVAPALVEAPVEAE